MKCPHCGTAIFSTKNRAQLDQNVGNSKIFAVIYQYCPACNQPIIELALPDRGPEQTILIFPKHANIPKLSQDVPAEFAADYHSACTVLADSPQASAALSRRGLQHVLREKAGASQRDLFDQIEAVLPSIPSRVGDLLHAVRVIGAFAAHPTKSTNSGAIMEVEPGEAEVSRDALRAAIDFYILKPIETNRRLQLVNAKLAEAGKQPLKP